MKTHDREITGAVADRVAEAMQALSTPSRVLILGRLRERPRSVTELVEATGMQQPAVSHQLRLLRDLGLVIGKRQGRMVIYSLYDDHGGELLDQPVGHVEHLLLGRPDEPTTD